MALLIAAQETPGSTEEQLVARAKELLAMGEEQMRAVALMVRAQRQKN
jgi:hypothetical protein